MRRPSRRLPQPIEDLGVDVVYGMRDARAPRAKADGFMRLLQNTYVPPGPLGLPVAGRPGFTRLGSAPLAGGGAGQFIGELSKSNGDRHRIAIVGGTFYTYDWGTGAFTEVLTAADLSGAGITLSTFSPVFGVEFFDTMVFSDGVNLPWTWDGTTNGGLVELTNAPVFYGQPWVHYAKLNGIKATERNAWVWSEEGFANTGYESGGYTNAWSPTGSGAFFAGIGSNNGQVIFEARRAILIQGAISTDYQTAGVRSEVSETIGASSPALVTDDGIWFVDADGRPQFAKIGAGEPYPIWEDAQEAIRRVSVAALSSARIVEDPDLDGVLFSLPEVGSSRPTLHLLYRAGSAGAMPRLVGLFRGYAFDTSGIWTDADGKPRRVHLDGGYVWLHGTPDDGPWNDRDANNTAVAIAHSVKTPFLGDDLAVEKDFDAVDLVLVPRTSMNIEVSCETPRATAGPFSVSATASGGFIVGVSRVGVDRLGRSAKEIHRRVGLGRDARGRSASISIDHEALNQRFGFVGCVVDATESDHDWSTP